ncbi:MAG: response regulator transcription factor [Clostridia bacterium]|nr:response regulator transcription factor [Clostridia bacterium]MDD7483590.1 response regulator transcription factor [Clostridia bacterium]MDY5558502.1 response regulator transcription factor [Candidatus Heritagella sp.]
MARICIVEDDLHIAQMIEATLTMMNYDCVRCEDGKQAVETILNNRFDLILLDIMLPELDGFGVLEKIRSREIPVIFLTAMGSVSDKVRGLRLGAEDYIVKPFEAMELLARIEVVLRRFHTDESSILQYDEIQVDIQRHTVTKDGEEVTLTPKQFDVLVFLMKHVDLAVSRDQLLSAVWGYEFEGESRTVDIHVQQVRKKMGLQGRLVTISKLGYRLESRNNR